MLLFVRPLVPFFLLRARLVERLLYASVPLSEARSTIMTDQTGAATRLAIPAAGLRQPAAGETMQISIDPCNFAWNLEMGAGRQ